MSFKLDDPMVAAHITQYPAWMKELNLAKTAHLNLPATPALHHNFTILKRSSIIILSNSVKSLWGTLEDPIANTSMTMKVCSMQH